jgi:hypothetical protein
MEIEVKRFRYRNMNWHCSVDFHHDRVEQTWDFLGLGIDRGKRPFMWQDLSSNLGSAVGRGKDPTKQLRIAGAGFILSVVLYHTLPRSVLILAYVVAGWSLVGFALSLRYFKSREWIQIFNNDGSLAMSLPVSNWSANQKAAFKDFFVEWLKSRG